MVLAIHVTQQPTNNCSTTAYFTTSLCTFPICMHLLYQNSTVLNSNNNIYLHLFTDLFLHAFVFAILLCFPPIPTGSLRSLSWYALSAQLSLTATLTAQSTSTLLLGVIFMCCAIGLLPTRIQQILLAFAVVVGTCCCCWPSLELLLPNAYSNSSAAYFAAALPTTVYRLLLGCSYHFRTYFCCF